MSTRYLKSGSFNQKCNNDGMSTNRRAQSYHRVMASTNPVSCFGARIPHHRRIAIGITILVCAVLCFPLLGQDTPVKTAPSISSEQLKELMESIRKKTKVPALAAAIVNSKGLVAIAAVGVRKVGSDEPVTVDDQFHLGSDTKAMTAMMIAQLVEQGKLSWDTALEKSFPDLAPSMTPEVRKITLTQLLTHHAGLPANLKGGWGAVPRSESLREQRRSVLKMTAEDQRELSSAGKFEYSNLGYTLAAAMAEQAAELDWETLMRERLFKPLGMKSAGFGPMGEPGPIQQPWQHRANGKPVEPRPRADNPPVMGPAGRVHCSLPDWSKFIADQLRGARGQPGLLQPATYAKLFSTPYQDRFYTRGGWGGTEKGPRTGSLVLAHDGSNTMNHATAWLSPSRDLAILVVTNQGGESGAEACTETREALLKLLLISR